MKQPTGQRRRAGTEPRRAMFCLLLVPVLLLAQVLGGQAALFHAHGSVGGHVHVLPAVHDDHAPSLSASWHHEQHENESRLPSPGEARVETADGILFQVPAFLVLTPDAGQRADKSITQHCALAGVELTGIVDIRPQFPLAKEFPDRPQNRRHRSGIATLLRSSRAILI